MLSPQPARAARAEQAAAGPRAGAEQRLVERGDELDAVAVEERLDERVADARRRASPPVVPFDERPEPRVLLGPLAAALAEQHGGAQRGGPEPVAGAEQRRRATSRSCSERNGSAWKSESSQRSSASPSSRVLVGGGDPLAQRGARAAAEHVEAGRLAGRLRRGDRQRRLDADRVAVDALEEDGAGGDRAADGEAERA